MSDEPLTKEEQDYEDDLIKRIKEIDQKLSAFQQTTGPTSNDPKMMLKKHKMLIL